MMNNIADNTLSNMRRHHFTLPARGTRARTILEKLCYQSGHEVIVAVAAGNGKLSHINATIVARDEESVRCSDGAVYHALSGMCLSPSRTYQAIHYRSSAWLVKRQTEEAAA